MSSKITKTHLGLVLFLVFNFLFQVVFKLEIDDRFVFVIKMLTYLSGLILFVTAIRRKSILRFYTSLYLISPVAVVLNWMMDGVFGAMLGSIFLGIWGPPISITTPKSIQQNGNHEIRSKFSGFLGGCCSYGLYEKRFLLFDVELADFRVDHAPEDISDFNVTDSHMVIHYKVEPQDSTIVQLN